MKFRGDGQTKASTLARRWVYECIASALENRTEQVEGWFSLDQPGVINPEVTESDRRRLKAAIRFVARQMRQKAKGER